MNKFNNSATYILLTGFILIAFILFYMQSRSNDQLEETVESTQNTEPADGIFFPTSSNIAELIESGEYIIVQYEYHKENFTNTILPLADTDDEESAETIKGIVIDTRKHFDDKIDEVEYAIQEVNDIQRKAAEKNRRFTSDELTKLRILNDQMNEWLAEVNELEKSLE